MKTNTTITLDTEILLEAKVKFGNLSGYINELLIEALKLPAGQSPKNLQEEIEILRNKETALNAQLIALKKEKEERDRNVVVM